MTGRTTGPIITGFLAIKDTAATRELLKKWNQVLTTRPQLNPPAFNRAIIEQGPNILQLPLSRTHFPSGDLFFDQQRVRHTVVVHNNFIIGFDNKVARFKRTGLWFDRDTSCYGGDE